MLGLIVSLTSIFASVAVVGSMIFVGYQIRVARDQMKGSATIAVMEYQKSLAEQLLNDDALYEMANRGNHSMDALNEREKQGYTLWCLKETWMWELCYHLRRQNALDQKLYDGKERYWLDLHSSPGRRAWWESHTIMLDPDFRTYVSAKLAGRAVRPLSDAHPIFVPVKANPSQPG